jgi:transcriptional regulator with XRE-family HTH domain
MLDSAPMDESLRTLFGARLRALRMAKGWSAEQAAQMLGLSRIYLYKLERGEIDLLLGTVERIDEVFDVDEFDLLIFPGVSVRHDVVDQLRSMSEDALRGLQEFLVKMRGTASGQNQSAQLADMSKAARD